MPGQRLNGGRAPAEPAREARQKWITPAYQRLPAGGAELGPNEINEEEAFAFS